jgi:N-methylhydantoinase A
MEAEARALLIDAGAPPEDISMTRMADMRHVGQGFEISVPVPGGLLDEAALPIFREAFFHAYQRLFERTVHDVAIEAMSWRLAATAPVPNIKLNFGGQPIGTGASLKGSRPVYFQETGFADCQVYNRYALRRGDSFAGPAVIEERESTTVIGPGATVSVDAHLNLVCELP